MMKTRDKLEIYDRNHICWECSHFKYDVSCKNVPYEHQDGRPYDRIPNDNSRCVVREVETQRFQWACTQFENRN